MQAFNEHLAPPRVVHYRFWTAENTSWGFHNVTIDRGDRTEASSSHRWMYSLHRETSRSWIFHASETDFAAIGFDNPARTVLLDRNNRLYSEQGLHTSKFFFQILRQVWDAGDADCQRAASHTGADKPIGTTEIAGIQTIGFRGKDQSGHELTIYLAPSHGCEALYEKYQHRNYFGIPTNIALREVVSYEIGEPDPNLFAVPEDYRKVASLTR